VDDNTTNRLIVREMFSKWGVWYQEANDGESALAAMEASAKAKEPFDLVLMDVQMPAIDGITAAKKMRNSKAEIRNIPIIALTAHAMKQDREKCLESGMDDYISKPIDPEKLKEIVVKWAKRSKPGTEAEKLSTVEKNGEGSGDKGLPIDMTAALKRAMRDSAFLKELIQQFTEHLPDEIKALSNALKKSDTQSIVKHTHSIKVRRPICVPMALRRQHSR